MPEKETKTSFVGGSDLVVFKESANKEAAWKFVEFLIDPKTQQKWYETVAALPAVESAWEGGELSTDEKLALFGEQLKDAKSPPPIPKWEQVAVEAVNAELEKATAGDASADQAANSMQQKAESIGTGA
jgi:multiple sugar transport system substrate-binding protein